MTELNAELQERLKRTGAVDLLTGLGHFSSIDKAHSERVGLLAMDAVFAMTGDASEALRAGYEGTVHDVGKADSQVQRLAKLARPLSDEEQAFVNRRHTTLGFSMLRALRVDGKDEGLRAGASMTALYHHSSPARLMAMNGTALTTRVVQIADKFDAMQDGERPYHQGNAYPAEDALAEIEQHLGAEGALDDVAEQTLGTLGRLSLERQAA